MRPRRKLRQLTGNVPRQATHISSLSAQLQSSRKAYLSTARAPVSRLHLAASSPHLTDAQRDALDADTKSIIRSTLSLITRLESAETIRVQAEAQIFKKKHSTLRSIWEDEALRDADAEAIKIVTAHREGIIWYLKNRLEKASEDQRERQEIRLNRQIERGKSLLYKAAPALPNRGMASSIATAKVAVDDEDERQSFEALSPDQLRIFEKENDGMLKHYGDALEQVRCVFTNAVLRIAG